MEYAEPDLFQEIPELYQGSRLDLPLANGISLVVAVEDGIVSIHIGKDMEVSAKYF